MQISARNQLEGIVRSIKEGPINSEVQIEIAPEIMITAQITTSSVKRLQLAIGKPAYALIKADSVMVGVD
ncbi:TOBE domain-containing protein [Oxalobacter formigenes]|uniref:TOBE domain protein n=1 Tax=Oxalobacter formigenes OXCC13 TaxID=556269 RepID=C3XBB6_OXAFO|nr:molybdopterin-binding protein [Oxalobacter formigenes]ARQ45344.1 Molybdenum-pterin-binding protein 2 [Oxalobacter formigenes]ARQ77628.1 transporter [Oxalobacter formigenes OXCC13]EEO30492.1 TOBE domain protein [Oxalobacter formigenes OXCC13]MCZ4063656.1 molybdopterin-binding protein [Oxalobacter formigenes]QDX33829.1 transporter [Oxalobacter formigenes]